MPGQLSCLLSSDVVPMARTACFTHGRKSRPKFHSTEPVCTFSHVHTYMCPQEVGSQPKGLLSAGRTVFYVDIVLNHTN